MNNGKLDVKGIMLDLDGTLLDTRPAYLEAAKVAFQATGQTLPPQATALEIPKRMEQRQSLTDIIHVNTKLFLDVYLRTFYKISASKTKPLPNTALILEALSQRAKLAIITMRYASGAVVLEELRQFSLEHYFAQVVTARDTPKPKPSPDALLKAVAAMGLELADCIMVGDSVIDVQAGKAAGTKTVAVLSGLYSRAELAAANPDYIINDLTELSQILN
jgi:HAD superfamily hydrolase (TIGR01509 family)